MLGHGPCSGARQAHRQRSVSSDTASVGWTWDFALLCLDPHSWLMVMGRRKLVIESLTHAAARKEAASTRVARTAKVLSGLVSQLAGTKISRDKSR